MARSLPVENLLPQNMGSIINYLQQSTEVAQWELQVSVGHNQLRTMASETVDPIDWSQPPPSWAVPPELHVLHGVNVVYTSQDLLQKTRPRVCQTNALPGRPLRVYNVIRYL